MKNFRCIIISLSVALVTVSGPVICQTPGSGTVLAAKAAELARSIKPLRGDPDFFPIVTQFSPVPNGKGWRGGKEPLGEKELRDTIDNILAHGFTGIETEVNRPESEKAFILNYAQSRGMILTHHAGALELFGRDKPPEPSVYSPEYEIKVRENALKALAPLKDLPRLYNVFTFQDEPFHWGPGSFGYGEYEQKAFRDRYGYDLPPDLASVKSDPKKWLDVINFRSDNFPAGWRKTHRIIKEINPGFIATMTHDSHNTFGAGYGSHSEIAIDDVYHWGGDFADMFVFDIYPYLMIDFRFGAPSELPFPRMSQAHYSFAQMRNLAVSSGKKLGFWVGTFNPAWFKSFMSEEVRAQYWVEQEMAMTAVAAGSDYLLTGYHIPVDSLHWEAFGKGNRLIQKTGGDLLKTPRTRAKACMLFPRTHYIQMQEEYFDVGLSFELFSRAFGELDILHEEQITDDRLNGYDALILFDVLLLPKKVAQHIASFVKNGGVVIADCVPALNEFKQPMTVMEDLFGVAGASTDRIVRTGHWIPYATEKPRWDFRSEDAPDESVFAADHLRSTVFGQPLDITLVSPRPCAVTTGRILVQTVEGNPAVIRRGVGKGQTFLLGFCLQDTYFKMWQDKNSAARAQLGGLLRSLTEEAGIRPHVRSSNPEIEASLRTNATGGYIFVINHEAEKNDTVIQLADLDFTIGGIVDVETGKRVNFSEKNGVVELRTGAARDGARILRLVAR
ncbi:MAG: hypothetical protein ACYC9O_10035 [Candidatus Latescibacterota bacterium]